MTVRDPYVVLGVAPDATEDKIKSAFRRLALLHHPDQNPGDEGAADRFKEINAAWQIVGDPTKRVAWDRRRPAQRKPPSTADEIASLIRIAHGRGEVAGRARGASDRRNGRAFDPERREPTDPELPHAEPGTPAAAILGAIQEGWRDGYAHGYGADDHRAWRAAPGEIPVYDRSFVAQTGRFKFYTAHWRREPGRGGDGTE